jgi:hypothetical protein
MYRTLNVVQQGQNDFLREWVPQRTQYLDQLLSLEALPGDGICDHCNKSDGIFRCSDCIGGFIYCWECCLQFHRLLPFHRIVRWNGEYFAKTTLHAQGYVLHLGHRGKPCPHNSAEGEEWLDADDEMDGLPGPGLFPDNSKEKVNDITEEEVDVLDTNGVFRHRIRWCQCPGAQNKPRQLFQMGIFAASLRRPETAFTFNVLDYFYIDAMECHTAASNFVTKVRRLTNNSFLDMVPVSLHVVYGRHHSQ